MLTSRSCPHTGILNYFSATDPFLAVGSVQPLSDDGVAWRCYIADHPASGAAANVRAAEKQLNAHVRVAEQAAADERIAVAA